MTLHPAIVLLGGLVVIIVGAELLLRGASRVAAMLGVSPLLVGIRTGRQVSRVEGVSFVLIDVAYMTVLLASRT